MQLGRCDINVNAEIREQTWEACLEWRTTQKNGGVISLPMITKRRTIVAYLRTLHKIYIGEYTVPERQNPFNPGSV